MFVLRRFVFTASLVLLVLACSQPDVSPPFTFTQHDIKFYFDPASRELTAIDTLSLQYGKNVDHIYFLLHKSLRVERVGVGHQDFRIEPMPVAEAKRLGKTMPAEWRELAGQSQIVRVAIPKSLYSQRIEIRYAGQVDLSGEVLAWHPLMPAMSATFRLTALVPYEFQVETNGALTRDDVQEQWRLNVWTVAEKCVCCRVRVVRGE